MMRTALISFLMAALCLLAPRAYAQDLDLGDESPLDMLDDGLEMGLEEGPIKADLSGLAQSCYLPIALWKDVRPVPQRGKPAPTGDFAWAADAKAAMPLTAAPITTRVAVPTAGTYRVFLRQLLVATASAPVTFTVRPVAGDAPGAPLHSYTFGAKPLDSTMTGKEHERKRPLIFESEPAILGMVNRATWVWEYTDVELAAGTYELALATDSKAPRLVGLLLTQAKGFRPSMDDFAEYNTMETVYLRYRVREAAGAATHGVSNGLTYHWRGRSAKGSTEPIWGWGIPNAAAVSTGEWTAFVDATDAIIPGPGPWSTLNMGLDGISAGIVDIEVAWRPEPSAVIYRMETRTAEGRARARVPHGLGLGVDGAEAPAWGVWRADHLARFVPEAAVVENYFSWAQDAMKRLNLPADHPRTKHIVINSSSRTTPAYNERAAEMLAILGVNWVHGASPRLIEKYDLIDGHWTANSTDFAGIHNHLRDEADRLYRHKVGDEIGTAVGSATVNSEIHLRDGFHAYLRAQAAAEGMTMRAFIGMDDPTLIDHTADLPARAGIYERRLYYHSNVYAHLASVPGYKRITEGFHERFPNVEVYNNYSPHPLFLTGATMNHGDWFVLTRHEAQTLAWGEDWAYRGSWGLRTKYQCTSYYAAIVAAAARRHSYPSGFYVGSNCGGSNYKMFSCVAQGLTRLHLYDWGPVDGWAEGSNAWSENQSEYFAIAQAAHALGPADTIVGEGERVQSRIAILYNRSHEIWQGGLGRMNHDWMWTYIAANGASEPVDVVIEDDLVGHIDDYQILVIGGLNLSAAHLAAVAKWVEAGGTLILTDGGAMYDTANDLNPATTALSGVRQRRIDQPEPERRAVTFTASAVSPAATFDATFMGNLRIASFEPVDATVIATWPDGTPAAATRDVGKGRVVTLGFYPGHSFRDTGQSTSPVQAWLTGLCRQILGEPVARLNVPGAETTTFTHDSGIAVLVTIYHPTEGAETVELSVKPDRPITSVRSALKGDLPFTKDGDRIVIQLPAPDPVDTVILR